MTVYESMYGFPQPIERLGVNPAWTPAPNFVPAFHPVSDADAAMDADADAMIALLVARMRRLAPCREQANATILMTLLRLSQGLEAHLMESYGTETRQ